MKAFQASAVGLKLGLLLGSGVYALLRWRFPAFFSEGPGEAARFVAAIALPTALLGFVLGMVTRRGGAIAFGATALAIAAAFAFLDLRTPSPAGIGSIALGSALIAYLVAARPQLATRRASVVCGAATVALLVAGGVAPAPARAQASDHAKILFFGLDAGTWTILDELFAKDQLPNLRRVRDEGTSGVLLSEVESASPRVWTTMATGKLPAHHGVLDFFCTQNDNLTTRRIWEILQAKGWSVGLFQWLVTWPPDPFDPFVVPAWMARGPETRPLELAFIKELELAFQTGEFEGWIAKGETLKALTKLRDWGRGYLVHGLRLKTALRVAALGAAASSGSGWEVQYAAKRTIQLLLNGDVYLDLYRRHQPDFSCFIAYGTDNLAHKFWQYHYPDDFGIPHEKAAPFGNFLTDYYRECDRILGEVLPLLSPRTTVAVVSDHGFTSFGEGGDSHQVEYKPRMNRIASLLGLTDADVTASSVATRGYFRARADSPRAEEVFKRTMGFLEGCAAVGSGAKVFLPKITESGQIEVAVNLAASFKADVPIDTPLGRNTFGDLVDIEERTGNHSIEGIVILRGPGFRKGARFTGARLQDVTPTLLHQQGLPIGADMDGQVLLDAFEPAFREGQEIERIKSWDDEVTVTRDTSVQGDASAFLNTARELGYVGDRSEAKDAGDHNGGKKDAPRKDGTPKDGGADQR